MQNEVYIRRGSLIISPDGLTNEPCKSINAAKRCSREIQKAGHKLRTEAPKSAPKFIPNYQGYGPKTGLNTGIHKPSARRSDGTAVKTKWKLKSGE